MKIYRDYIKRGIDICISLVAMVFVIIVGIPIAIAIKVEDGGSVLYGGLRYGKDMKEFSMYKFRSMKENVADIRNTDGTTFNAPDDPRLTKVGQFIRRTSLDEFPQFYNVLKGDMSFIGPRPSPMGNEGTYTDFIKKKFLVKPGITGYNQALLRNKATLEERYKNDVYYAENISFVLDIKIVIMTIVSVFKGKNIYNSHKATSKVDGT